jgi:hypothetical protein
VRIATTLHAVRVYLLVALAAACSGRKADSAGVRKDPRTVIAPDAAERASRDARDVADAAPQLPSPVSKEFETGAITGATARAIACPVHGGANRKCFAVAHGPFVLTDLEAFAYPWFPTQTQGWQQAIAFPGPSGVAELPPAFVPRWHTQATEYWGSGWKNQPAEDWNSGLPQVHRTLRAVHGARYFVGDREDLYVAVSYRGCWNDDAFERDACSPGSAPEISATFSGYHTR